MGEITVIFQLSKWVLVHHPSGCSPTLAAPVPHAPVPDPSPAPPAPPAPRQFECCRSIALAQR